MVDTTTVKNQNVPRVLVPAAPQDVTSEAFKIWAQDIVSILTELTSTTAGALILTGDLDMNGNDITMGGGDLDMEEGILSNPLDPTTDDHVGDRGYNDGRYAIGDQATADFLAVAGDSMEGTLNLANNIILAPLDPTLGTHIGDRDYNDIRYAEVTGATFSGAVAMGNQVLSGPLDPSGGTHVGDRDYNDARYAELSGATYTGAVAMGNQILSGPLDPASGTHVGDRDYNDTRYIQESERTDFVAVVGDTMTGSLILPRILGDDDTADFDIAASASTSSGRVVLYGATHATKPKDIEFLSSTSLVGGFEFFGLTWHFDHNTKLGSTAGADVHTLAAFDAVDQGGRLTFEGADTYADLLLAHSADDLAVVTNTSATSELTLANVGAGDFDLALSGDVTLGGDVVLASGQGVDFSATGNGSGTMSSELLNDYEEGEWTPVLSDGTNNATMSAQDAGYTKIGNRVFFEFRIATTSLGSVSGALRVTGLPYTVQANARFGACCSFGTGLAITQFENVTGVPAFSTSYIGLYLWDEATGTTVMTDSEWSADGQIIMFGQFTV